MTESVKENTCILCVAFAAQKFAPSKKFWKIDY